jgi:hypothetical protein
MNLGTMQGDKHFCGRHSVKLAQLKACSQSKQGAYSRSHAYPTSQHVQNARGFRSTSRSTLILFTHTASRSKSKGLKINVLFYSYTLYTRNVAYKKQGAPDRRPVLRLYFLHVQCRIQKARRSRSEYHYTFHTHSSLTYEKPGASIYI